VRYRSLRWFQHLVHLTITRMTRVALFVQTRSRVLIAKRAVERKREQWCDNSPESRCPLLDQISEQLVMVPSQWLSGDPRDEKTIATLKQTIAKSFFSSPSPSAVPTASLITSQLCFVPLPSVPLVTASDETHSSHTQRSQLRNASDWAEEMFRALEIPKSSFGPVDGTPADLDLDLTSSQHVLVPLCSLDGISDVRDEKKNLSLSLSSEWIRRTSAALEPTEMHTSDDLGDVCSLKESAVGADSDGYRLNVSKYYHPVRYTPLTALSERRETGRDTDDLPPLFYLMGETDRESMREREGGREGERPLT
jgi:hypothetical protein